MIIAVDFDGTITEHEFPRLGKSIPGAIYWMKTWQKAGAKLILWTMRSDVFLKDAEDYLKDAGIELYGSNFNKQQTTWTNSPKVYAHLYVDDAAFGCPLIHPENGTRPYVDWNEVGPAVLKMIEEGS